MRHWICLSGQRVAGSGVDAERESAAAPDEGGDQVEDGQPVGGSLQQVFPIGFSILWTGATLVAQRTRDASSGTHRHVLPVSR
jgi:hypothetical protein